MRQLDNGRTKRLSEALRSRGKCKSRVSKGDSKLLSPHSTGLNQKLTAFSSWAVTGGPLRHD